MLRIAWHFYLICSYFFFIDYNISSATMEVLPVGSQRSEPLDNFFAGRIATKAKNPVTLQRKSNFSDILSESVQ